jgi:large subunit ribosomal protein L17
MRHGKKTNHLGRKRGHRRALLSNLASALITNKRILTTVAKAKELRRYIEPLITKSKDNSTHSRRVVFSYLQDKVAAKELFDVIAVKVVDRPGGYVRIIRYENRPGDNAEMAFIELVDFNEVYTADGKKTQTPKAKRTRRGGAAVAKPKAEEKEEVQDDSRNCRNRDQQKKLLLSRK